MGGIFCSGLHGEAPPQRGAFFGPATRACNIQKGREICCFKMFKGHQNSFQMEGDSSLF